MSWKAAQYTVLALIFGSLDLVTMAAYAVAGERATRFFDAASTRLRIDRACGATLLLLATSLALLRRPPSDATPELERRIAEKLERKPLEGGEQP